MLDPEKNNAAKANEAFISKPDSRVKVLVIPTNEELVVAREVKRFLDKAESAALDAPTTRDTEQLITSH